MVRGCCPGLYVNMMALPIFVTGKTGGVEAIWHGVLLIRFPVSDVDFVSPYV